MAAPRARRGVVAACVALALAAAALLATACSSSPPASANDPAARAVNSLLELRHARSRDAKAYGLFFKSDAIPKSLADAAAKETTKTKPPIPEWEAPYVSATTSKTVDVVVVWKNSSDYPNHPAATLFTLGQYHNRWVVLDARQVTDSGKVPPPAKR